MTHDLGESDAIVRGGRHHQQRGGKAPLTVYWIKSHTQSRLAIMPRPRAGDWLDDEIAGWKADGIDIVVSLLEANEVYELGLSQE